MVHFFFQSEPHLKIFVSSAIQYISLVKQTLVSEFVCKINGFVFFQILKSNFKVYWKQIIL